MKDANWDSNDKISFFFSPGYPYFLSIIYAIFGNKIFYPVLIQFIFGCLIAVLIYEIIAVQISQMLIPAETKPVNICCFHDKDHSASPKDFFLQKDLR
ncbi:MAG: hypothetical protein AB1633_02990, partial [Elusimicrobiota bacterium]